MDIIKRDGRKVPFDVSKIYIAIQSAVKEVEKQTGTLDKEDLAGTISTEICTEIMNDDKDASVEEIQDLVEKKLMTSDRKDVAKAYILYRNERTKIRSFNTSMMKDIIEKLYAKNVKNQNANIDENSFGGRVGEAADTMMKRIALESGIMSERAVFNHINNRIYTHDLGSYVIAMHNCLTLPIDILFRFGVKTRQTAIRGAKSVSTAFQLLAVYFQLQSLNQFG